MLSRARAVWKGHRDRLNGTDAARDAGVTLIELVVGMTLATVVGMCAVTYFVSTSRDVDRISDQTYSTATARATVEQMASQLRLVDSATSRPGSSIARFAEMKSNRVVFFANLDSGSRSGDAPRTPPVKVALYIDTLGGDTIVRQDLWQPKVRYTTYPDPYDWAANYPTTRTSTAVLARPVGAVRFWYCTTKIDPSVGCDFATSANGDDIASVKISYVPAVPKGVRKQTLWTTIAVLGARPVTA